MYSGDDFGNEDDVYGGYSDAEPQQDDRGSPWDGPIASNGAGPSRLPTAPRSPARNSILSYVKVETSKKGKRDQPQDCASVLNNVFGYSSFRGKQKEAVEAALQDSDVFVLAPTGMGKSLCFQVPALAANRGVTLVISPLLALMKNQVEALREKGVSVASLTSETPRAVKDTVIRDLNSSRPDIRLLYISPERFCKPDFQRMVETLHENGSLNRLVVDEAHCISQWGHDFRAEYRKLGMFRESFPDVPIMALTATATPAVQADILRSLNMAGDRLHKALHPFNRANLYYEVRYTNQPGGQMKDIHEIVSRLHERRGRPSSGIIYCRKRDTCDELAKYLRKKGMNARPYHRGLKGPELDKTLAEWTAGGQVEGDLHVVVATIAFGLGIDKPDVRYVIHHDLPTSFEGYYQETGRAGRDGAPSRCILYYSREDAYSTKKLVQRSLAERAQHIGADGPAPSQRSVDSFDELVSFAHRTDTCRHVSICRYFGEVIDARDAEVVKGYCNKMCDVCKNPTKTQNLKQRLSEESTALMRTSSWNDRKPVSRTSSENASGWQLNQRAAPVESAPPTFKRPTIDDYAESSRAAKKTKVELPAPLVTRQYGSYNALRKPFRPPLMKVQSVQQPTSSSAAVAPQAPPVPPPGRFPRREVVEEVVEEEEEEEDDVVEIVESPVKPEPVEAPTEPEDDPPDSFSEGQDRDDDLLMDDYNAGMPSSPIDLPHVDVQLEVAYSNKVPVHVREEGFRSIRVALHKAFAQDNDRLWAACEATAPSLANRDTILSCATKELEFLAQSLSSTPSGYEDRVAGKVDALGLMRKRGKWREEDEEYEDAREITGILKRLCAPKGQGRR
ncbi:P-loop containing nucleoside triphosphate hydrolase protein [Schizophyllum amplum]|uniref:ATP-dependent DNA helicase n=1 Tax=Schizophyllum amplum TaxID=97359 RepID=A0A550C759_9AGAR|nr:P-loop containing nucleoside triphosphate hydrolase protein [Auriculariopsis ampla]